MQHTVAAVFDNYGEAQHAVDDLVACGFSRDDVHLSQRNETGATDESQVGGTERTTEEESGSIGAFFRRLFGTDDETGDAELYSEAVRRGSYVLTVEVPDDQLLDQATDVIDRHHPIDIDERASQWRSGGWASHESMRMAPSDTPGTPEASDTASGTAEAGMQTAEGATEEGTSRAVPVVEEQVRVGKREVQRGGVRVYQRVTEQPVHEQVQLRDEHVSVERHPVDKPASEADLSALKDQSFEVREMAEEPVVEKMARVVEEVVVGKEAGQRTETIDDTVRRTDVEVEQLSGQQSSQQGLVGDDDFRSHWNSAYAQGGESYEDYAPAYQYGSTMASDERYRGRQWADIEPDIRADWEQRYPQSAWQKFKDAVRHGWERMTS
jgi:uncharacterized protein (TIGR02271 family)